jgi:hypothetical protein
MAGPSSSLDPFALWRDLVSQVSKDANQWANRGMQTDEFAQGMHQLMGPMLAFGKLSTKAKQRYFEVMNLPSRSDVEALGERLQAVEDKLIDLVAMLERGQGGAASARARSPAAGNPHPVARLPRTRKPPPDPDEPRQEPVAAPKKHPSAARRKKARA